MPMPNKITVITFLESVYLLYMYFFFKTSYTFTGAKFEKATESLGQMFIHDTGAFENKVCLFGKYMAILAVILASVRAYMLTFYPGQKTRILYFTSGFNMICLSLAYMMNLNAFVYLLPILFLEIYLFL